MQSNAWRTSWSMEGEYWTRKRGHLRRTFCGVDLFWWEIHFWCVLWWKFGEFVCLFMKVWWVGVLHFWNKQMKIEMLIGSFGGHLGLLLESFWGRFWVILGALGGHFCIPEASWNASCLLVHPRRSPGPSQEGLGEAPGPFRGGFWANLARTRFFLIEKRVFFGGHFGRKSTHLGANLPPESPLEQCRSLLEVSWRMWGKKTPILLKQW